MRFIFVVIGIISLMLVGSGLFVFKSNVEVNNVVIDEKFHGEYMNLFVLEEGDEE